MSEMTDLQSPFVFRPIAALLDGVDNLGRKLQMRILNGNIEPHSLYDLGAAADRAGPLLQQAVDEILPTQGMPLRELESSLRIRSAGSRRRRSFVYLSPFQRLVKAIYKGWIADLIGENVSLLVNPTHVTTPITSINRSTGLHPALYSGYPRHIQGYSPEMLAKAAKIDPALILRGFKIWRDGMVEIFGGPGYVSFQVRVDMPSAHEGLVARREVGCLLRSGLFDSPTPAD